MAGRGGLIAGYLVVNIVLTIVTWLIKKATGIAAYGLEFPLVGSCWVSLSLPPPSRLEIFGDTQPVGAG